MGRRVGIFGGSFDPIHLGHLRAAEEASRLLDLDLVYFIPAANPPHKPDRDLTDPETRFRMVELATADRASFRASRIEIDRGGTSYSVDTLRALQRLEPEASLYFLMGRDTFREIHSWRDAPTLFELANLVVVTRPPEIEEPSVTHLPVAARERLCYDPNTRSYRHQSGHHLIFLTISALDVSATDIRRRLREGRSVEGLLPPAVEHLARDRNLYGATTD